ncbi:MAG TPA: hypothetical protein VMU84_13285 [Thermoanaerobaculia bacterium]|nr:hypothetical protein [Thermoanaerobaculia bacterium]
MLLLLATFAVAAFAWWLRSKRANDHFEGIMSRHRPTAKICSRAELVDGRNHISVALTLEPWHIFYENLDLEAAVELERIDEVEYASDLITGGIADGAVLRLRSHGRALEFILDMASAEKWSKLLPPHRINEPGRVHAV